LEHHATGGVDNGGYVSIAAANAPAVTSFLYDGSPSATGAIVFRANNADDASGDAFVGNWGLAGANTVRAYLRHNYQSRPVEFYVRLTNGPAAVFFATQTVPVGNDWTLLEFPINPSNMTFAGGDYHAVLGGVQNFQIGARILSTPAPAPGTTVLFDVDQVSLATPEPSSLLLAAGSLAFGMFGRRKRQR
jgi:hypothetical protein